jgi:hypothetical protein
MQPDRRHVDAAAAALPGAAVRVHAHAQQRRPSPTLVMREVDRVSRARTPPRSADLERVTITALLVFLVALTRCSLVTSFGVLGSLYGAVFLAARRYLTRTSREAVARRRAHQGGQRGDGRLQGPEGGGREGAACALRPASRARRDIRATVNAISTLPRYALEAIAVGGVVTVISLMAGREGTFASTLPLLGAYVFAALRLIPAMQYLFQNFAVLAPCIGRRGAPRRPTSRAATRPATPCASRPTAPVRAHHRAPRRRVPVPGRRRRRAHGAST